jgi:hypothetical protein
VQHRAGLGQDLARGAVLAGPAGVLARAQGGDDLDQRAGAGPGRSSGSTASQPGGSGAPAATQGGGSARASGA